eukprot:TRINITY_DN15375_c0_g1_i2.p1 TRINITY_DN15375_c0_g1~~TRINITY_DN15375_c0_g1_i2.p1  ORF type:complete len:134 (-),score=26.42 TRINITY_DN15375_c0_g1_i2:66-467(-)
MYHPIHKMATEDWTGPNLAPNWENFQKLFEPGALEEYLKSGGSPETRGGYYTLLGKAVFDNNKGYVELLLKSNANPNLLCNWNWNGNYYPLDFAMDDEMVQLLVAYGAHNAKFTYTKNRELRGWLENAKLYRK